MSPSPSDLVAAVEQSRMYGPLDVLVNCAGVFGREDFFAVSETCPLFSLPGSPARPRTHHQSI
jgi:NAD(P)-dependent dehydrogenase (short-subunit alcohol dehydrogenase family)